MGRNYYAWTPGEGKLNGVPFYIITAFPTEEERDRWVASEPHRVKLDSGRAHMQAWKDRIMFCRFPAKPDPAWDEGGWVWYPVSAKDDGYEMYDMTEWELYEVRDGVVLGPDF